MLLEKSIPVTLYEVVGYETDGFGKKQPVTVPVVVQHCLVAQNVADAVVDQTTLETNREQFTIAIPKGDSHKWEESMVEFVLAGEQIKARTFGATLKGIEALVPTYWHKQIKAERYE